MSRFRSAPVAVGMIAAGAMAPVYWHLSSGPEATIRGQNDFPGSLTEAAWAGVVPFRPPAPHFLLPFLSRILGAGVGLRAGMVVVCVVAAGLTFGGIAAWSSRPSRPGASGMGGSITPGAVVAGGLLLLETPALLIPFTPAGSTPWWGRSVVVDLHHWVSPTNMALLACFVPLAALIVRATEDLRSRPAVSPHWPWIAALAVLASLAKPSLTLPSIAAVPGFVLWRCGRDRRALQLIAAYWLPAVAITMWQVWFLRSGQTPFDSAGGWRLRPFWVFGQDGMDRPAMYLLLLLVPLALWAGGRDVRADPLVRLLGLVWLAAMFPTLLLQETGPQAGDANFTVGSQLSYFLLTAAVLVRLADRAPQRRGRPAREAAPLVALVLFLVLGLIAGAWAYLDAIGVVHRA